MLLLITLLASVTLSKLLEIGSEEFKTIKKAGKTMPVVFFAPWCGHCKALKPKYKKAAEELGDLIDLYMVDCTDEKNGGQSLCSRYEVKGYPTVKMINPSSGERSLDYQGPRETEPIKSWVLKNMHKPFQELKYTEDAVKAFETATTEDKPTLILLTKNKGPTSLLFKIAAAYKDSVETHVLFGMTDSKTTKLQASSMGPHVGNKALNLIYASKGKVSAYSGENKPEEIDAWIKGVL